MRTEPRLATTHHCRTVHNGFIAQPAQQHSPRRGLHALLKRHRHEHLCLDASPPRADVHPGRLDNNDRAAPSISGFTSINQSCSQSVLLAESTAPPRRCAFRVMPTCIACHNPNSISGSNDQPSQTQTDLCSFVGLVKHKSCPKDMHADQCSTLKLGQIRSDPCTSLGLVKRRSCPKDTHKDQCRQ